MSTLILSRFPVRPEAMLEFTSCSGGSTEMTAVTARRPGVFFWLLGGGGKTAPKRIQEVGAFFG